MKKIIFGFAIILIIIGVCLGFRFSVNSKIEAKIEELNKNGFAVKHEQSFEKYKTKGNGQIEVVYPQKVASYLISKIEDEELKKSLEKEFGFFDRTTKDELFEGITFDYDYTINNLTSKMDLNVYLTKISTKSTYNISQTYAYSTNPQEKYWFDSLLKDKKIHLNIDENGNFKFSDLSFIVPNQAFFTIREVSGNKKAIKIGLLKISDLYNDSYTKGNLIVDNINIDYDLNKNKKTSKIALENIEYKSYESQFRAKNTVIDSTSLQDELNISGNSKFSFDEVIIEKLDSLSFKNIKIADLKKTSLEIAFDKIPFKKYEEMIDSLTLSNNNDFAKKYDDFVKAFSSNGISISSKGEANSYNISNKLYFNGLKYELILGLNKNIPSLKEVKSVKDIFDIAKFTFDIDTQSALDLAKELSKENSEITAIQTQDNNTKRFEVELKSEGVYINGVKSIDEKELEFPSFATNDGYQQGNINVSHTYELVNENLLRVKFKYTPNNQDISAGGISVSFPQLKDASKIKAYNTTTFDKIEYYPAGKEIYSGMLGENVKTEYLLVEGWDENWTDSTIEKEFSIDIDITDMKNSYLEINLRAGAVNKKGSDKDSEIVPNDTESYTKDQQGYPVNIADIDLYTLTNSAK